MKLKSNLLILVGGLLSLTSLVGCNQNGQPSSPSSSDVISTESSPSISDVTSSSEEETLKITKQPAEVIEIHYPDGVEFSFEVNKPELVKSYQWQYFDGYEQPEPGPFGFGASLEDDLIERWLPLRGIDTTSNKLSIISSDNIATSDTYRCEITDINNNVIYTDSCEYRVINHGEYKKIAYLGEYAIEPGDTLDLADTPYGKGKISYDENGVDFIFDNVHFCNDFYSVDPRCGGLCFMIETHDNVEPNYSITFKGTNVMTNNYWEDNDNQGGYSFYFGFLGQNKKPTVTFKGDGNLTIFGGSYSIIAYCNLVIDIDINLLGLPKRLTKGILADQITIKKNRHVNATLGGTLFFVEYSDNKGVNCSVTLEENTSIQANIDCGSVSQGNTLVYGIAAAGPVVANKSNIVINVVADLDFFSDRFGGISSCEGLYSANYLVKLNDSNYKFSFKTTQKEDLPEPLCTGIMGISGVGVELDNSNIDIDIDSKYINGSYAIYSNHTFIKDCTLDLFVRAYMQANGICASIKEVDDDSGILDISGSNIRLKVDDINPGQVTGTVDSGLKCGTLKLDLKGEEKIEVDIEGCNAIVVCYESSLTPAEYTEGYVAKYLVLDDYNVTYKANVVSPNVNLGNYRQFDVDTLSYYYVNFESIFDNEAKPVGYVLLTAK